MSFFLQYAQNITEVEQPPIYDSVNDVFTITSTKTYTISPVLLAQANLDAQANIIALGNYDVKTATAEYQNIMDSCTVLEAARNQNPIVIQQAQQTLSPLIQ